MNNVTLTGNLGRDPELRYASSGTAVVNMSIADNSRIKKNGDWETKTQWFTVVVFGTQAENVAAIAKKGDMVTVYGRLQNREYTDRDGNKHRVTEIIANNVHKVTNLRFKSKDQQVTTEPEAPTVDDADLPF